MGSNSIKHQSFGYTELNDQTILFLIVQFCISHLFAHSLNIKQFYLTHPIRCYSEAGSDSNEGVLRIPQISGITGVSSSDCLASYPGHLLVGGSYPSVEMQSAYSTTLIDWALLY